MMIDQYVKAHGFGKTVDEQIIENCVRSLIIKQNAEMAQLEADKARLLESSEWLVECMEDINDDISAEDLTNAVLDLSELISEMKAK
jgi:hypothetical protein